MAASRVTILCIDRVHSKITGKSLAALPKAIRRAGADCVVTGNVSDVPKDTTVVMIFNELRSDLAQVRQIESTLRRKGCAIVNSVEQAEILRDKRATRWLYELYEVPVPPSDGERRIAMPAQGSNTRVRVLEAGQKPRDGDHVAALVDTVHDYKGCGYHVCLRSWAVGGVHVSTAVRARPADQSPSVHAKNTPRDPDLIDYLHDTIVTPNVTVIEDMCARAGKALKVCVVGHDVLPCARTGNFYICETGFKFTSDTSVKRFANEPRLPESLKTFTDGSHEARLARALLGQLNVNTASHRTVVGW